MVKNHICEGKESFHVKTKESTYVNLVVYKKKLCTILGLGVGVYIAGLIITAFS